MTLYTLGILPIGPASIDGPNYQQSAKRVMILTDGSTDQNEVLQQGSTPKLEWRLTGKLFESADADILTAYNKSKETVTFADAVTGDSWAVLVFDCSIKRKYPRLWEYDVTLIQADGSGSGS